MHICSDPWQQRSLRLRDPISHKALSGESTVLSLTRFGTTDCFRNVSEGNRIFIDKDSAMAIAALALALHLGMVLSAQLPCMYAALYSDWLSNKIVAPRPLRPAFLQLYPVTPSPSFANKMLLLLTSTHPHGATLIVKNNEHETSQSPPKVHLHSHSHSTSYCEAFHRLLGGQVQFILWTLVY